MGRPFSKELEKLTGTIYWANNLNLDELIKTVSQYNAPVYIVGSGGSFSACVYTADLLTYKGLFAKALTPLELFYSNAGLKNSNIIFISSSGRNVDILFAFKKAAEHEPISILNICMQKSTKLGQLAQNYSGNSTFEFANPAGKDGFLATNSLVAYFVIMHRAILNQDVPKLDAINDLSIKTFVKAIKKNSVISILYGTCTRSVAIDIESKFTESGLGATLISDYRHFAHGRHQWFDKQKNSAIVAIMTSSDEKLGSKTLDLLPKSIPKLVLKGTLSELSAPVELLIQSMKLAELMGAKVSIDPGRPGVPPYGSKIYHLRYEKLLNSSTTSNQVTAILRKAKVNRITDLSNSDLRRWNEHYQIFVKKITSVNYGSLVLDYDGTLCSSTNRFLGLTTEIKNLLISFVKKGFVLGIISGRGKSLREEIIKIFGHNTDLIDRVLLGYYNGSDIAPLSNENHPNKTKEIHPSIDIIAKRAKDLKLEFDLSPNQITFGSKAFSRWNNIKGELLNEFMLLDLEDLTMVESSHSIDIIPRKISSKNNILSHCFKKCRDLGISEIPLCIGDKGQWPGNDYELLANEYSLSVGEVSSSPEKGWNICPPGLKNEKGFAYLFSKIANSKGYFRLMDL